MRRTDVASQQVYNWHGGQSGGGGVNISGVSTEAPRLANGASALGNVVDQALNLGGKLTELWAREYKEEQTARVDDRLISVAREFEIWKAEYRDTHQGASAVTAARDYENKYRELAQAAAADFGKGNEIFSGLLKQRLAERGAQALREGAAYGERQKALWIDSQLETQEAEFLKFARENAGNPDAVNAELANLMGSMRAKRPGLELGGQELALRERADAQAERERARTLDLMRKTARARLEGLIDAGDYEGARKLLDSPAPQAASGSTIAEQFHNPLNLKKPGANSGGREDFRQFSSDAEGYRAALAQLKLYQKRGKRTVAEMVSTWAPASENNLKAYAATLKKFGFGWKDVVDLNDLSQAAAFTHAMSLHEGPVGKRYTVAQVREMLAGGDSADGLFSPTERAGLLDFIERRQAKAQAEAEEAAENKLVQDFIGESRGLDDIERERRAAEIIDAETDPDKRRRLMSKIGAELKFRAEAEQAQANAGGRQIYQDALALKMSPVEMLQYINNREDRPAAEREVAKKYVTAGSLKESVENRQALATALSAVDMGELASAEEREVWAINHGLTEKQRIQLLEYRGKMDDVSMDRVLAAARSCGLAETMKVKQGSFEALMLFEMVRQEIPNGRPATTADIQRAIFNLNMNGSIKGRFWGSDTMPLGKAKLGKKEEEWLPEVPEYLIPLMETWLKSNDRKVTKRNIQKAYKFSRGIKDNTKWDE